MATRPVVVQLTAIFVAIVIAIFVATPIVAIITLMVLSNESRRPVEQDAVARPRASSLHRTGTSDKHIGIGTSDSHHGTSAGDRTPVESMTSHGAATQRFAQTVRSSG